MCQCTGSCGHALCCRAGRRLRVAHDGDLCARCQGEPGREQKVARKRPAAAESEEPRVGASAGEPAMRMAGALERTAAAVEKLLDEQATRPGMPGSSSSHVSPVTERQPADVRVPENLQGLLAAAEAASNEGGGAEGVVASSGFAVGHPRRGLAFAILHGLIAVARPSARLSGLCEKQQGTVNSRRRSDQYFRGGMTVCMIATFASVDVSTIIQCLARDFRASPDWRASRGQRFVDELGQLWSGLSRV